jgi:hypothetical protein
LRFSEKGTDLILLRRPDALPVFIPEDIPGENPVAVVIKQMKTPNPQMRFLTGIGEAVEEAPVIHDKHLSAAGRFVLFFDDDRPRERPGTDSSFLKGKLKSRIVKLRRFQADTSPVALMEMIGKTGTLRPFEPEKIQAEPVGFGRG